MTFKSHFGLLCQVSMTKGVKDSRTKNKPAIKPGDPEGEVNY